jgi:ligand-binding sensor domain-containing protein/two-component sensor histidine kinase
MKPSILLILLLVLVDETVFSQPEALYFDRITVQNGLSHNKVNCITQDSRGFTWIGTDDGLNRFDGDHFTIFRNDPARSNSLSGNLITDIVEDREGILWIATADGGLCRYDYQLAPAQQFKQYKHLPNDPHSIPVNILHKLLNDPAGYLWLATSDQFVLRFNKKTEQFSAPIGKGTKTILSLDFADENHIWAGREGGGLLKINTTDLSSVTDNRYSNLYGSEALPHVTITALYKDSKKNIWMGSWDKLLYQYETGKQKERSFNRSPTPYSYRPDEINCFAEDSQGNIWMGGKYNGLQVFNASQHAFRNYVHVAAEEGSLSSNQVNCVFIDAHGTIWVGTNNGLNTSNPLQLQFTQEFLPVEKGAHTTIYDFYEDGEAQIWLATSAGIFIEQKSGGWQKHAFQYKNTPLDITKIYRAKNGQLLLGTNYSLFILDSSDFTIRPFPNIDQDTVMKKLIKSRIVSITEDSLENEPALIVSPYGHFITYYLWQSRKWVSRLDTSRKIIRKLQIRDNLVHKLYKQDAAGTLFMATVKDGLGIWNKKANLFEFKQNDPQQKDGLSNNHIYDCVLDKNQTLWISTYGGGLHRLNTATGQLQHIGTSNNLLEGLQPDQSGNIWAISNGHLDKYNPASGAYTSFQLPDIERTGGVRGNMFKDSKERLYVAGQNYFIRFLPSGIREQQADGAVHFTDFRIFDQSNNQFLYKPIISLPYDKNFITIEFAAPQYISKKQVLYQYRMPGTIDHWINLGYEHKVSFSNLAAGSYHFEVRASHKPGIWFKNTANLSFEVLPPFWKKIWFYAGLALAAGGIVFAIYRYRINEITKRQDIRNKIAQDLHDNIGSTLSSISVYSQVAKIYQQTQKQEELKQALEKISTTSSEMINEISDIVWTINPRNDSMPVMLQRMESFARPLLGAVGVDLQFKIDAAVKNLHLNMTQRKNFYLIFKEAVNNVLKYAQANALTVAIFQQERSLVMEIKDNGIGFDPAVADGNGLQNMIVRAREMNGICQISSAPGKGSSLLVKFPIT